MSLFGFPIQVRDIIDILLVTLLLYETYRLLKNYGAAAVFHGILLFFMAWFFVVFVFRLPLLGSILNNVLSVGAVALLIIFHDEVRMFFGRLGTRTGRSWLVRISNIMRKGSQKDALDADVEKMVLPVVLACKNMSQTKTGALIVFERNESLNTYLVSGERLDAQPSARLIENIFFKNTPLHDGALIANKHLLIAAACVLPVSRNMDIPQHFGLRHRAALGVTEKTDAVAVIVSEETGHISVAMQGQITENITPQQLELLLTQQLQG